MVWLDRPTRCRKVAKLRGEPIWQTSSIGPMSMPSSSEAVATSARRSPPRSRASTRCLRSFDRLPWCAATWPSPSRSPSSCAIRSAIRLVLTKTIVVRCSCTWPAMRSMISAICSVVATAPSSSEGSSRCRSSARRCPESTIEQRGEPSGSDRPGPAPTSSLATTLDRALGRRQPDPLDRLAGDVRRAAPESAPGASRACCRPPHGSRRRSPWSRRAAWPAVARPSAAGRATPAW